MEKVEFIDNQMLDDNFRICESCGAVMEESCCKMKCRRCGYFRSCSDLF